MSSEPSLRFAQSALSGRQLRGLAVAVGVAACALPTAAHAEVPLSDSKDGISCRFIAAGARMAWQREGGDWVDAAGQAFGAAAYVSDPVPPGRAGQQLSLDVSALAQAWQKGEGPVGGMMLMRPPGGGVLRLHSREAGAPELRPRLDIVWADGKTSRWSPSADASINCSTSKTLGDDDTIAVGSGRHAVLQFPALLRDAGIRTATLHLTVQRLRGAAGTLAVFRPLVPWAAPAIPRSGLARAFPRDVGIAAHPAVVRAERFEDARWAEGFTRIGKKSDVELAGPGAGSGFVPRDGKALRITIRAGRNQGLNTHLRFGDSPAVQPDEMFFRYALRLGDDWDPSVSGGKMPGFSGTYNRAAWGGRKANGSNGWSTRGAFFEVDDADSPVGALRGIGSYVYHADMPDRHGQLWGWNQGVGGLLQKNRWYAVEQQVRLNTPGRGDGVLRAWIDGVMVFERTDLRFRDVPDLKIESLWLNVWHGGTKPAVKDMSLFIDNLVVAREYIGPVFAEPGTQTQR